MLTELEQHLKESLAGYKLFPDGFLLTNHTCTICGLPRSDIMVNRVDYHVGCLVAKESGDPTLKDVAQELFEFHRDSVFQEVGNLNLNTRLGKSIQEVIDKALKRKYKMRRVDALKEYYDG